LQAFTKFYQPPTGGEKEQHDAKIENIHDDFLSSKDSNQKSINAVKTISVKEIK